jgi:hypothetical protein
MNHYFRSPATYDRRLRPRRQNIAVLFCLVMIGIAVAVTFAVARIHEASIADIDAPLIATSARGF